SQSASATTDTSPGRTAGDRKDAGGERKDGAGPPRDGGAQPKDRVVIKPPKGDEPVVVATGGELRSFSSPNASVLAAAIPPDGRRVIGAPALLADTLYVWDADTGQQLACFQRLHQDTVTQLLITSDGKRCVSSSRMGDVTVLDLNTGQKLYQRPPNKLS